MVNSKGGFLVEDGKELDEDLRAKEKERERAAAAAAEELERQKKSNGESSPRSSRDRGDSRGSRSSTDKRKLEGIQWLYAY